MLPDRTDPERRFSADERIMTAHSRFEREAISEAVYRATLFGAGMRGEAIETEVRARRGFRTLAEVTAPIVAPWVSGLA